MQFRSRSVLAAAMALALAGFTAACDNNDDNDNGLTGSTNASPSPAATATPAPNNPSPSPSASPDDDNGGNTGRTFTGEIQSIDYRSQSLTIDERGVVSVTNETKLKDSAGRRIELRDFRVGDIVRYDGYRAGSGQYFLTKLVLTSR